MDLGFPQFSSTPGVATPAILKAFEDPETSRETLAALLAAPAPARNLALAPPRIVVHPHLVLDDLLAAAAVAGSLAAALLTNAGVLLRLVEIHYAGAATREAQQAFVAALAPIISHDSLLHLTLHHSPAIRSFTRDVVRWHVQQRGDQEGLRMALRHSGDYGVLAPADYLEGAALELTALDELEAVEEADAENAAIVAFLSSRTNQVWVVNRAQRLAQTEDAQVMLVDGWWRFQQGPTVLRIRRAGAGESTAAPSAAARLRLRRAQSSRAHAEGSPKSALTVSLRLGLLRLTEPWELEDKRFPPADPDWRQVAGEGIAALIKAGAA